MKAINGYKTYAACVAIVIYAIGVKHGLWPNDQQWWAVLSAAALAALRSAIKNGPMPDGH